MIQKVHWVHKHSTLGQVSRMTSILEFERSLNSCTLVVQRPLAYFRSANVKTFCKYEKSIENDVNCFVQKIGNGCKNNKSKVDKEKYSSASTTQNTHSPLLGKDAIAGSYDESNEGRQNESMSNDAFQDEEIEFEPKPVMSDVQKELKGFSGSIMSFLINVRTMFDELLGDNENSKSKYDVTNLRDTFMTFSLDNSINNLKLCIFSLCFLFKVVQFLLWVVKRLRVVKLVSHLTRWIFILR